MHVVEPEHDRLHASGLFEQRRDLALEPLLRSAGGFGGQPRRGRIILCRRHELCVPARRERPDEACEAAKLFAPLKAFERLQYRQIGLAAGQPFGAAAAADARRLATLFELGNEGIDERGFPDAGFARNHDHPGFAPPGALELVVHRRELVFTPDDVRARRQAARGDGDRRQRGRNIRIVRERQPIHHLARARPETLILLQRFEDQLIQRARKLWIEKRRRLRRFPYQGVQRPELRGRHERMTARDELVQHDAEREDISFGGDRLSSRLFRRHVADRAENQPGLRSCVRPVPVDPAPY